MEKTIEIQLKEHGERISNAILSHYPSATRGEAQIDKINLAMLISDLAHLARTTK